MPFLCVSLMCLFVFSSVSILVLFFSSRLFPALSISELYSAMSPLCLLYHLISWHLGGCLYRGLYYVELVQPRFIASRSVYGSPDTGWHSYYSLLLCLVNPSIVLYYAVIGSYVASLIYSSLLIFYVLVCYCIVLYLVLFFSRYAWKTTKLSTRWSICRQLYYYARCYGRDIVEGQFPMPHMLPLYLLSCLFFSAWQSVLSQSLQLATIIVFLTSYFLSGRHISLSYPLWYISCLTLA